MIENLIYDVGMNNGDDTAYYLHCGYRVVAIEAHPILAATGKERFASEIAAGRLQIVNVGIAETDCVAPFWICEEHSEWSSFHKESAARDGCRHRTVNVPCRPFASILEEFGIPYFLKVDIEGNDLLCMQALRQTALPKYVSVESSLDALAALHELGYTGFKCISQFHYLPVELPPSWEQRCFELFLRIRGSNHPIAEFAKRLGLRRVLEIGLGRTRRLRGWKFPSGSSGPFAEDTPGRWQAFGELLEAYQELVRVRNAHGSSVFWEKTAYSFWTDFHARRDD